MSWLVALVLVAAAQEPTVAELIRRLDTGDIEVREKTERDLAARGAPALAEVEVGSPGTELEFAL